MTSGTQQASSSTPKQIRNGITTSFVINDTAYGGRTKGFLTITFNEDGQPWEVFLRVSKWGSTMQGLCSWAAINMSLALQAGVTIDRLVKTTRYYDFPPKGSTDDPEIQNVKSIAEYVLRKLEEVSA